MMSPATTLASTARPTGQLASVSRVASRPRSSLVAACTASLHGGLHRNHRSKAPTSKASPKELEYLSNSSFELEGDLTTGPDYHIVQRNLALEIVRVTEAAALAAGKWQGKGDKNAADQAAVDMMRKVLNTIKMDGTIVIGEGEKDEAPMLYCGEHVGDGSYPQVDIAVDPLDGTSLTATGRDGAIAVIAVAERGALYDPGPCMYMEKLVVGPEVLPHSVSLKYSTKRNLMAVAEAQRKSISEVTAVILDRPRHEKLIQEVRDAGARIRLISDGDVAASIEVCRPDSSVDILLGVGGTPEGVISAAAMKCMGGTMQGRLWPRNDEERVKAVEQGYELEDILFVEDLCGGEQVFFAATGVTDGNLLEGVRYFGGGATTNSIVMRAESGTVRVMETTHRWNKPGVTNVDHHHHNHPSKRM
uniref:Fructose-bisphosphatase n=1 Tax=Tetraselmis chuii TaxID=63592 RepID=A0A7S1T9Q0_9CHLO|mmetsp:Transcript_914/g.1595  ORF Transcript_914/g.1595 Transcript_914/m.1595 type:complete len:418 (+) Transcript_914:203-1456(+)